MELDRHFTYLPLMSLAAYGQDGIGPVSLSSLSEKFNELEESDIGVLFDLSQPEGDVLGHPDASSILADCESRGLPVTLRLPFKNLKPRKSILDVLCQRGLVDEIRLMDFKDEIEKAGFFQSLLKLSPEMVRRMALEVDVFEFPPTALDAMAKPVMPEERRDTDIPYGAQRSLRLPRVLLRLDEDADPFEAEYEQKVSHWKAELTGLLKFARISFDVGAYQAIQPHRIASFMRPVEKRVPVFFVSDVLCGEG